MSKLIIQTLTWNASQKLSRLRETLIPSLEGLDYLWYIKDNNSNDNTYEMASDWGDKVRAIKYKNNLQNFSEGMNFIFMEANPKDDDLILLLNNDVSFGDTKSIKKMISLLKKDVGVVGSKLLYTGTNRLQHAGVVFEPQYGLPTHFRANQEADEESNKNRCFQAVTGAIMLIRASDYRNISGPDKMMDCNLRWAFDDIDLCLSVKNNMNKKILYCGETNIFHDESASLKKNPVNKLFMNYNANYFVNKWKGKYEVDISKYAQDKNYNIFKVG